MEHHDGKRKYDGRDHYNKRRKYFKFDNQDILSEAPADISVVEYAKCRAAEIQALDAATKDIKVSKLTHGMMNINMRRRAMSYNVKRMPRRIREHITNVAKETKRPSRKHRRRPKNLLQEYTRRQRNKVWLETHIWHAKRFRMVEKWGYKIPVTPTNKSSRASYRATQHYCQMVDISYMCCIEIYGQEQKMLEGLSHITNHAAGTTFAAKKFIDGTREGNCVIYQCGKFPMNAIAGVTFLWNPVSDKESQRQMWIWCHPSAYQEVWNELELCFKESEKCEVTDFSEEISTQMELSKLNPENSNLADYLKTNNNEFVEKNAVNGDKTDKKCKLKKENKKSKNQADVKKVLNKKCQIGNIMLISLKDKLVRHRLIGPLSQHVLSETLHTANIIPSVNGNTRWWENYYNSRENSFQFSEQRDFWESACHCGSPAELPPHCVLGLTVRDPRITRAKMRNQIQAKDQDKVCDLGLCKEKLSTEIPSSPIWQKTIRDQVQSSKIPDFKLNQLKSDLLVPGSDLNLEEESRIPVLLVQRPGITPEVWEQQCHSHYGCGWDMILPAGWSMPFWISNTFHGGRAGGLRELQCLAAEQQLTHFPNDYPDTKAGKEEEAVLKSEKETEHAKRPPAKRPNFTKLGVKNPFNCPWNQLVSQSDSEGNDSMGVNSDFYVLRDRPDIFTLKKLFSSKFYNKTKKQDENMFKDLILSSQNIIQKHKNSIVFVKVSMLGKDCPEELAMISVPIPDDLKTLKDDKNFIGPLKSQQPDLELEAKKAQKKKTKLQKKGLLNIYHEKTTPHMHKKDGDREIIGYIKHGGFALSYGHGAGTGFCSVSGLGKLMGQLYHQQAVVLIRNPRTLQYRFAYLYL